VDDIHTKRGAKGGAEKAFWGRVYRLKNTVERRSNPHTHRSSSQAALIMVFGIKEAGSNPQSASEGGKRDSKKSSYSKAFL